MINLLSVIPNVLVLVSLYAVLTNILYIIYISKSENDIIKNNINYLIDNFLPNKYFLDEQLRKTILTSINNISTENLKKLDDEKIKNNKDIINKSIKNISIIFIVCITLVFAWCYYFNLDFAQIILNNTIIIVFLLFVQLAFFYIIRTQYLIADTNIVKNKFANLIF
jgi:hypothetical protein